MLNTQHIETVRSFPESVALNPMIQLRQVVKCYHTPAGEVPALRGIDLDIAAGEFVAVVGKSGAGKSTLVNMITGIDRPDSGEIIIGGIPIHTLSEDQRSRWRGLNMGVVFQFFQLLPSINLVKNITISMDFCNRYTSRERKERAQLLLEQVGIAEHAHKRPSQISGGQQQRLAIARAMANDPGIIVADEPTGNLDSRTTTEIMDLFVDLAEQGKTLLIVTHDAGLAARAGRQVHIADGEIVQ
jgi:ABC-type lipoprotein export system ATPase subunit